MRPFLPEEFTPLFHTASYRALTDGQRLRYNQLHGLYFNEQLMFFESVIGRGVLCTLVRELPPRLADMVQQFWEEEQRHTAMFRRLSHRRAPQLYAATDFHFIRVPGPWMASLRWATCHPRFFLMFLWLMMLQEERSIFYSRAFLREADRLDPAFVAVHRAHVADEVDHVRWDEELLDALWGRAPRPLRQFNASLFSWMLDEFFHTPKRGQLRVVLELLREFPDLRPREPALRRDLRALRHDPDYQRSLYSREIVPRTFARFDAWPEFRTLERKIAGYRRPLEVNP